MTTGVRGPWAGAPTLRRRRRYVATREEVFRAFTDPALLRQWFSPKGWRIENVVFPAIEGQSFRVALRDPDGNRFVHAGRFLRVNPPSELVYTFQWVEGPMLPTETLVELAFIEDGDGVLVELRHTRFENQIECGKHDLGWSDALDRLAALIAGRLKSPGR